MIIIGVIIISIITIYMINKNSSSSKTYKRRIEKSKTVPSTTVPSEVVTSEETTPQKAMIGYNNNNELLPANSSFHNNITLQKKLLYSYLRLLSPNTPPSVWTHVDNLPEFGWNNTSNGLEMVFLSLDKIYNTYPAGLDDIMNDWALMNYKDELRRLYPFNNPFSNNPKYKDSPFKFTEDNFVGQGKASKDLVNPSSYKILRNGRPYTCNTESIVFEGQDLHGLPYQSHMRWLTDNAKPKNHPLFDKEEDTVNWDTSYSRYKLGIPDNAFAELVVYPIETGGQYNGAFPVNCFVNRKCGSKEPKVEKIEDDIIENYGCEYTKENLLSNILKDAVKTDNSIQSIIRGSSKERYSLASRNDWLNRHDLIHKWETGKTCIDITGKDILSTFTKVYNPWKKLLGYADNECLGLFPPIVDGNAPILIKDPSEKVGKIIYRNDVSVDELSKINNSGFIMFDMGDYDLQRNLEQVLQKACTDSGGTFANRKCKKSGDNYSTLLENSLKQSCNTNTDCGGKREKCLPFWTPKLKFVDNKLKKDSLGNPDYEFEHKKWCSMLKFDCNQIPAAGGAGRPQDHLEPRCSYNGQSLCYYNDSLLLPYKALVNKNDCRNLDMTELTLGKVGEEILINTVNNGYAKGKIESVLDGIFTVIFTDDRFQIVNIDNVKEFKLALADLYKNIPGNKGTCSTGKNKLERPSAKVEIYNPSTDKYDIQNYKAGKFSYQYWQKGSGQWFNVGKTFRTANDVSILLQNPYHQVSPSAMWKLLAHGPPEDPIIKNNSIKQNAYTPQWLEKRVKFPKGVYELDIDPLVRLGQRKTYLSKQFIKNLFPNTQNETWPASNNSLFSQMICYQLIEDVTWYEAEKAVCDMFLRGDTGAEDPNGNFPYGSWWSFMSMPRENINPIIFGMGGISGSINSTSGFIGLGYNSIQLTNKPQAPSNEPFTAYQNELMSLSDPICNIPFNAKQNNCANMWHVDFTLDLLNYFKNGYVDRSKLEDAKNRGISTAYTPYKGWETMTEIVGCTDNCNDPESLFSKTQKGSIPQTGLSFKSIDCASNNFKTEEACKRNEFCEWTNDKCGWNNRIPISVNNIIDGSHAHMEFKQSDKDYKRDELKWRAPTSDISSLNKLDKYELDYP
jgi:hypothetical protein